MKKLILEFDDLHWLKPENCISSIQELVKRHSDIKLTFFSVPKLRGHSINGDPLFYADIKVVEKNVRLALHGYFHNTLEFEKVTYEEARAKIVAGSIILNVGFGDMFIKVFRGPHWGLNANTIKVLKESEFTHIYNHEDHKHLECSDIKFVYYNWNLKDEYVDNGEEIVIAHGHTHEVCGNNIATSIDKISNFIEKYNPEFLFANEI